MSDGAADLAAVPDRVHDVGHQPAVADVMDLDLADQRVVKPADLVVPDGEDHVVGGEDLRSLLPALWLGQWLQIGKSYDIGSGCYELALLGGSKAG